MAGPSIVVLSSTELHDIMATVDSELPNNDRTCIHGPFSLFRVEVSPDNVQHQPVGEKGVPQDEASLDPRSTASILFGAINRQDCFMRPRLVPNRNVA